MILFELILGFWMELSLLCSRVSVSVGAQTLLAPGLIFAIIFFFVRIHEGIRRDRLLEQFGLDLSRGYVVRLGDKTPGTQAPSAYLAQSLQEELAAYFGGTFLVNGATARDHEGELIEALVVSFPALSSDVRRAVIKHLEREERSYAYYAYSNPVLDREHSVD